MLSGLDGYANSTCMNSTTPVTFSKISPSMFSRSILGTLFITSIIRSPAEPASEKYFMLDKLEPSALVNNIEG
uniref:Uncharacterized protein n=1 Tax=Rhizophora mucronata TaxID=61149 RepID=A0A2P2JA82_RHIMU